MGKIENINYDVLTETDVEELIKFTNIITWRHLVDDFNNPQWSEGHLMSNFVLQEYEFSDKAKTFEDMISYEKLRIYNCKAEVFEKISKEIDLEALTMTDDDFECLKSVINTDVIYKYFNANINGYRYRIDISLSDLEESIMLLKETRKQCDKENDQLKLACIKCEILYHKAKIDQIMKLC